MLLFNSSGRAACNYFSIRPMLLFNSVAIREGICKLKFQYILCCYSTWTYTMLFVASKCFQYILCCYSTLCKIESKMFVNNFNTSYVIIQLYLPDFLYIVQIYFNTSYVIIQPTKNRHSCILLISINHDLKPFFQHFTNHSIENQLFVRNHVFTPFDRLFQKITW